MFAQTTKLQQLRLVNSSPMKSRKPRKAANQPASVYQALVQKMIQEKKIHALTPNFFTRN